MFDEERKLTRRALILGSGKVILGSVIAGRLVYLGVFKSPEFRSLSEGNRIKLQLILPKRGLLYDRHNQVLADNKQSFRLIIIPEESKNVKLTLQKAALLLHLSPDDQAAALQSIQSKPRFVATILAEELSWEELCRLEVRLIDMPGCSVESSWVRYYPHGEATAHVLGYVQTPSSGDQEEDPLFRLHNFKLGKTGLEKKLDDSLRGSAGYKQLEVNARHRLIRELDVSESLPGTNFQLTLDLNLQKYLQETLARHEAAGAVVVDIPTGEVLGLHSHPSFDPNLFTHGIKKADWQALLKNSYRPLHNKVIQGVYAPGSIFKMIVALAALEAGIISPTYATTCAHYIQVKGHRFHCWQKEGHGRVDLVHALRQSCDVFFYEIAQKLGSKKISLMAKRFGLGALSGIEIPGEKAGLIPISSWQKPLKLGETILMGIGQGPLLTTPLQLAMAMACLVHPEQRFFKPTLLKTPLSPLGDPLNLEPEHISLVKRGLDETVNSPFGLAYGSRIWTTGFEMGGKTSTVQVRRITMEERTRGVLKNEQRPWEHRDHAIFAGYAPIQRPRFAIAVIVEHGGGGGRVAAPLGRDILYKTQQLIGSV
jgi:penicillin-binding protein 2